MPKSNFYYGKMLSFSFFFVRLLDHNQITDLRPLGKSGNMEFIGLYVNGSLIQPTPLQPNLLNLN